ncbi:universal stress protein [Ovoidimarina sediminis]|uniref:universal stress protein n=1 Tax=Ovoidimarina sediminis TaxID=3079856 RepID=UPI00290EF9AA|nr:universal stress protein [Rhodophyticola sp. MJ-SS7]MDU8945266.1 universal stress protein [Rhodophyticola sp. MJ-SS7]
MSGRPKLKEGDVMYGNILVAMALDHNVSEKTLEIARMISSPGAKITALHVLEEPQGTANARLREDLLQQGTERAKALFDEKLGGAAGVERALIQGHVGRTILSYAEEHGVDCIVMGSHKPGLADYLLGSTAARVTRHAACSVHVYRGG